MPEHPFPRRVKSPPLDGGHAWINTAGPLDIEELRGKFVLLDFWTYCCINCMHILPELKKLEAAYPNELVVIGVHSAKFDTEQDSDNIKEAVLRYDIEHPVVNDADHAIWDNFFVSSWPSLRIIDPEGNVVAGHSGEIDFAALDDFFKQALPYYRAKGLLDETPLHFALARAQAEATPLRFPGKLLADEAGDRLFISDSNHNRIVVAKLDGTLIETIGSGQLGAADGDFATATFNRPQGMALQGETLYLADTENHLLRKIDLAAKTVTTIAGTGEQGRNPWPGLDLLNRDDQGRPGLPERFVGPARETALNSPWDLWIHDQTLYIAMAGPHQIWAMPLDEREIGPFAGNGREDIVDGTLLPNEPYAEGFASFAQPSGLTSDGNTLFVADSEGSSIRSIPFGGQGNVETIIGTAHLPAGRLFEFGDVDGAAPDARLQHALGVCYYRGVLYVADTYNSKIKQIDVAKRAVATLVGKPEQVGENPPATATLFDEPSGLAAAGGKLYVADTNHHLIRVIDLDHENRTTTLTIAGLTPPQAPVVARPRFAGAEKIEVPAARLKAVDGKIKLQVQISLPEGYKLNDQAPSGYQVDPVGDAGPVERSALGQWHKLDPPAAEFAVELPVAGTGADRLHVGVRFYYCREGRDGLCKMDQVVFELPVEIADDATENAVTLAHAVVDGPKALPGEGTGGTDIAPPSDAAAPQNP
ncbi:MAG: redoxin domain-containing protein [Pirellulales bacterium]|nr:redoxin domain-containing protein [Pirellulales bacterium]